MPSKRVLIAREVTSLEVSEQKLQEAIPISLIKETNVTIFNI
jgi:hypothetical protein